ncbi:MAG: hypothetical protein N0E59_01775 [Candidatus Thiodiazotropha taylori]|nr:hypothetical protein [Candidatus Thiodiazotropha endolucinida]MCG8109470.1 hypothetical protein [Candidatus Thiodiazotropha taylori]MCW4281811.1 hypothetical protein [Candidatus Thiodiazotropha taylori]
MCRERESVVETIDVLTAPIAATSGSLPYIIKDYQTIFGTILSTSHIMWTPHINNKNQQEQQLEQKEHDLKIQ